MNQESMLPSKESYFQKTKTTPVQCFHTITYQATIYCLIYSPEKILQIWEIGSKKPKIVNTYKMTANRVMKITSDDFSNVYFLMEDGIRCWNINELIKGEEGKWIGLTGLREKLEKNEGLQMQYCLIIPNPNKCLTLYLFFNNSSISIYEDSTLIRETLPHSPTFQIILAKPNSKERLSKEKYIKVVMKIQGNSYPLCLSNTELHKIAEKESFIDSTIKERNLNYYEDDERAELEPIEAMDYSSSLKMVVTTQQRILIAYDIIEYDLHKEISYVLQKRVRINLMNQANFFDICLRDSNAHLLYATKDKVGIIDLENLKVFKKNVKQKLQTEKIIDKVRWGEKQGEFFALTCQSKKDARIYTGYFMLEEEKQCNETSIISNKG